MPPPLWICPRPFFATFQQSRSSLFTKFWSSSLTVWGRPPPGMLVIRYHHVIVWRGWRVDVTDGTFNQSQSTLIDCCSGSPFLLFSPFKRRALDRSSAVVLGRTCNNRDTFCRVWTLRQVAPTNRVQRVLDWTVNRKLNNLEVATCDLPNNVRFSRFLASVLRSTRR